MLMGIDPVLSPDILFALRSMGHGHRLAIVDANYPCDPDDRVIRADGISCTALLDAILTLLPLETKDPQVACRMIVAGNPKTELPIFGEFSEILARRTGQVLTLARLDPAAFKDAARKGFVVILSGDHRHYGNILITKGVV
jgi:L-fucose mutarotase